MTLVGAPTQETLAAAAALQPALAGAIGVYVHAHVQSALHTTVAGWRMIHDT